MSAEAELTVREVNPMNLIALSLEKGLAADQMTKLYDLAERWYNQEAERAFNTDFATCQAQLPKIVCDDFNKQTSTPYPKLETMIARCLPIINHRGFSISFTTVPSHLADHYCVVMEIQHKAGFTKTRQLDLPSDVAGPKGVPNKSPVQGVVSTFSYAERTLFAKAWCLVIADTDQDGNMNVDMTEINEKELAQLEKLLEGRSIEKFLAWASKLAGFGIASIDQTPRVVFLEAAKMFRGKEGAA